MGKICDEHVNCCFGCQYFAEKGNFHRCLKDDMSNPTIAKMIKDITLNHMKEGGKNEF